MADVTPYGLDFALPALFIALLVMSIKSRGQIAAAVLAGLLSTVFMLLGLDHWSIVAATLIAATGGLALEPWIKKRLS